jgi:hypothetical protein
VNIASVFDQIAQSAYGFPFIRQIKEVDRTDHALKLRLIIDANLLVQIYTNSKTKTTAYALVLGEERIYGRDCHSGRWHRHPFGDPQSHDTSKEGRKEIDVADFLNEVQQILKEQQLL